MIPCPNKNTLSRFVEGKLDAEEFQQADTHIESCDVCQATLESITHDRVAAGHEVQPKPFLKQIAKRIGRQKPGDEPSQRERPDFLSNENLWPEDYRVQGELGRGGMGIVYEAQQISLGRPVALKVIPQSLLDNELSIQRFELEARTAAQLQHEHIVPVHEVGAAENYNWYSMRLIEGKSLDQVIKSARSAVNESGISRRDVLSSLAKSHLVGDLVSKRQLDKYENSPQTNKTTDPTFEQTAKVSTGSTSKLRPHKSYYHGIATIGQHVAEALAHAHENGVVHRDIKPSNLLLDQNGKVWVADFGLAKKDNQELTRTGDVVGTLRFLSPERLDGINDRRGDIYSLGMTLYEMLALGPAFEGVSQYNVIEKIRNENPARLKDIDSAIPPDLITVIEKATEKDPTRRYASAQLMAEDLELFLAGRPIRARRVSQMEHFVSWAKRNPGIATALASIFLLVLAGLVGTSIAAFQFRDMAIEQERLADVADKESKENQQNLYYAEMKLGVEAGQSPYGRRALLEILGHWKPQDETQTDRRGFEWYWLNSMLHPNVDSLVEQGSHGFQFSSDGRQLCRYGTEAIELVSWPEFKELWTWYPDERPYLNNAKFDSAFGRVAILSVPKTVQPDSGNSALLVLDWKTDESLFELDEGGPLAMAWSPDGSQLAVLIPRELPDTDKCSIKVFSTKTWKVTHEFDVHQKVQQYDTDIEFSNDGHWLAISVENIQLFDERTKWTHGNYGILCYETENWELQDSYFQMNWSGISSFDWHPTRSALAIMSLNGTVVRWEVDEGTALETNLENWMQTIGWDSRGQNIVLAGDGFVRVLDAALEPRRHWLFSDEHTIFALPHPQNDDIVVAVAKEGQSKTFLLSQDHQPKRVIFGPAIKHVSHSEWEGKLFWSPDGTRLLSSLDRGSTIWDTATGMPKYLDDKYECSFVGMGFGWISNDDYLSAYSGNVSIRDATGTIKPNELPKIGNLIGLDSKGSHIYSFGNLNPQVNWGLEKINLETGSITEIIPIQEGYVKCPGNHNPADKLFALGVDNRLIVVDLGSKSIVHEFDVKQSINAIAWSKDGRFLAYAGESGLITIRESVSFEIVAKYQGHTGKIFALDWSPDGKRLASGGLDKAVRLWDTSKGQQVIALEQDTGINAVAWDPTGRRLATINFGGYTTIYDATTGYRSTSKKD